MRTLPTIWCASLVWLALLALPSTAQVPYDLSRAAEFKTVWRQELGGGPHEFSFLRSFGGRPGLDILTTGITGVRGNQTWSTRPSLDTTNLFNWLGINNAIHVRALDYDGIPPFEYVNSKGIIWRCATGSTSPFPLTPIDTAAYPSCVNEPELSVDIDGDGFLDVITGVGYAGQTARIIMGGPMAGKGCERVFTIPRVDNLNKYNYVSAFYRSSRGGWVLVQSERDSNALSPWMRIYGVTITRHGSNLSASFSKLDSLRGSGVTTDDEPFGGVEVLIDTIEKRDYILLQHRLGVNPGTVVVEKFDVTERSFNSTGERVTGFSFVLNENLGYELGLTKPVIAISSSEGLLFCTSDNIRQPFARMRFENTGLQPKRGIAVVNDQTGDGMPDVIVTGGSPENGVMVLVSLDPNLTSVNNSGPHGGPPVQSQLRGDVLELTLVQPTLIAVDLVSTDGRVLRILQAVQSNPGINRFDLGQTLRPLPNGAYRLLVRVGQSFTTIPFIR